VSTPTGDIAAMVRDGQTGCLVPADDPAALASAVSDLLGRPEWAQRMARQARQELTKYTWPQVRDAWASLYAEVAA
jgi:glycosyltransferase involved in cell wall biosynthesis